MKYILTLHTIFSRFNVYKSLSTTFFLLNVSKDVEKILYFMPLVFSFQIFH